MRYLIIFVLLWVYPTAMFAKASIDSLTNILNTYYVNDTAKVNLLNKLGYEYWIINPAQSELYGKQALHLADSLGYRNGYAFANRIIGVSLWARGHYPAALQYLTKSLTTYQQLNDTLGMGTIYSNIGLVHHDQQNYEVALQYYHHALDIYEALGNKEKQAAALINIGHTCLQMKEYSRAENIYTHVLELSQAIGRKYGIAESLSSLGELHLLQHNTDQALTFLLQSLDIRSSIEDHEGSAMCYYLIGKAYLVQHKHTLARKYLQHGINKAKQVSSLKWVTLIYETLKDVEVKSGNHPLAIQYFEAYTAHKDSLFNSEKSRQIAEMQIRFETVEKEHKLQTQGKQLALLQQQARFDKLWKNSFLMGLIAFAIITYLIISRQRLNIKRNKELLAKNEEIFRTEQALAQAQLENARLQEVKLIEELESKNKKLTSYSLNFIQKNELMEELKENIDELKKKQSRENLKELNGLNRLVENSIQIDKDWEEFKHHFEGVHKDFYRVLKECYPDLTNHELKLCTLLKLNMNLKEAAAIMGISPESVKKARHRLRKKFNLTREDNLIDHIIGIEKGIITENLSVA